MILGLKHLAAVAAVVAAAAACGGPATDAAGRTTSGPTSTVTTSVGPTSSTRPAPGPTGGAPTTTAAPKVPPFTNPVIDVDFPDPHVHIEGGTFYAYATNDGTTNVQLQTSTDLATWTVQPDAMPTLPSWADKGFTWAPHVYTFGDTRVLYFAGAEEGSTEECLGVATASSPLGPFVAVGDEPLVCQADLGGAIDPSVHVAGEDAWLVWKSDGDSDGQQTALWSQPLTPDGTALAPGSSPAKLLEPTEAWQDGIIEAPLLHDLDGQLFLVYSANWYNTADYAIGYATCTSPAGPCTNVSTSPWISSGADAAGPGGQTIFAGADGTWWIGYHAWTPGVVGSAPGAMRSLRLDAMEVNGSTLASDAPTSGVGEG